MATQSLALTHRDQEIPGPIRETSPTIFANSRLQRPTVKGKFLYIGNNKLWVRGVTYGTFRPDSDGYQYNKRIIEQDFAQIAANGLNAIRTYTVPPRWFLDAALLYGFRVMVGIPWEQHIAFLEDKKNARSIEERVRGGVRACAGHPAVLCYAIGNEIPAPIVRWHGRGPIEHFLKSLYLAAKEEDPDGESIFIKWLGNTIRQPTISRNKQRRLEKSLGISSV